MRVERFQSEDISRLMNYGGQEHLVPLASAEDIAVLTKKGDHYSFFVGDDLVGCAGVVPMHDFRGAAWALLQEGRPEVFAALHKSIYRILVALPYQRIEAYVDPSFPPAGRWMRLLGFELETPFKPFFFPDGRGAAEWVRLGD